MYAIQYGHQICTICFDEEHPVGRVFEQISAEPSNHTSRIPKETTLKCNHVFHSQCINRYLNDGNKRCPTCCTFIEKEDRNFEMTEDPAPPQNKRCFFESTPERSRMFICPDDLPEEEIRFFLEIQGNPFDHPRFAHLTRTSLSGTFQLPLPSILYADRQGVIHLDL